MTAAYPHDTVCAGCHACQPDRFPNTTAGWCGCRVCNPTGLALTCFFMAKPLLAYRTVRRSE